MHPSNSDPELRPDEGPHQPSDDRHGAAIKEAVVDPRPDWYLIERLVRDYVRILKEQGLWPERAVSEAKALVVAATGDPMSTILPSVVTWTLSEYYDRLRARPTH